MSTRTAARSSRRPATAADVRVSATLASFFGDRVTVTLSLVNGPQRVDVSATVSCDLRGGDPRVMGGQDYRSRDLEADPRSLERLLALAADRLPAAARAAVLDAAAKGDRKAAEERAEGDEERALKLERRAAFLRAAVA